MIINIDRASLNFQAFILQLNQINAATFEIFPTQHSFKIAKTGVISRLDNFLRIEYISISKQHIIWATCLTMPKK